MSQAELTFEAVVADLAEAGLRLVELKACEGAAGNLSVLLPDGVEPSSSYGNAETIELPLSVPEMARRSFLVSGSGTRMRDILRHPGSCLGYLRVDNGGRTGTLYSDASRAFARITSEFNSHLAVHRSVFDAVGTGHHAIVHAQPRSLTFLSHRPEFQNAYEVNRRLLRWQPEAILNFPEGLGLVPFLVPGQAELMRANESELRRCRLVIWAKHGVMARSFSSAQAAVDLIEYAETAATYELMDLVTGQRGEGLGSDDLRRVALAYGVAQQLF
ncbi:MAG: class II aldolase/adducin family protein [Polyangiaceae bacterium]